MRGMDKNNNQQKTELMAGLKLELMRCRWREGGKKTGEMNE